MVKNWKTIKFVSLYMTNAILKMSMGQEMSRKGWLIMEMSTEIMME